MMKAEHGIGQAPVPGIQELPFGGPDQQGACTPGAQEAKVSHLCSRRGCVLASAIYRPAQTKGFFLLRMAREIPEEARARSSIRQIPLADPQISILRTALEDQVMAGIAADCEFLILAVWIAPKQALAILKKGKGIVRWLLPLGAIQVERNFL